MNKKSITIIASTVIIIIVAIFIKHNFGNHNDQSSHQGIKENTHAIEWTPSTRSALIKEMHAITKNYQDLVSNLVQGDWEKVTEKSHAIYSSFILKQELSEEDMHDLHRILPERFLDMDLQFHNHAKKLAMAAKQHGGELAAFYSWKLMDGCVNCHEIYATDSFAGFSEQVETNYEH